MISLPGGCVRSIACAVLLSGRTLSIVGPAGAVALSYDGRYTTARRAGAGAFVVELDAFDVLQAIFAELYLAAGGEPGHTFRLVDGNMIRETHYMTSPWARQAADTAFWRAVAAVVPHRLPKPIQGAILLELGAIVARAEGVVAAKRALVEMCLTAGSADANALARASYIHAQRMLEEAREDLEAARAYQARVNDIAIACGLAIAGEDLEPATSRIGVDRRRPRTTGSARR